MDSIASPLELKQRADELYASQQYLEAAEEYRKLIQIQPSNTQLFKQLGLALTLGKQIDEGINILKTAAAMQPADPEIRYSYGYALGTAGKFDEAIEELDVALNLQPNHIPARQGLVYCLLTSGQAITQVNPNLGEQRLDRALKLDPRNTHVSSALLDFLVKSGQKGKVTNLIKDFDAHLKSQSPLKELIDKLEKDPDFSVHLKQIAVSKPNPGLAATPVSPGGALKQVPCPGCRQPIMDYAAICPHCNFRIRATGTFANRDTGPKHEWQEITFTIMSVVWILLAGLEFWQAYPQAQKEDFGGLSMVQLASACIQAFIGFGLLFRQEWIGFIGKIFCMLTLGRASIFLMITMMAGIWLAAGIFFVQLAIAGFMIYLINYVMGE